MQCVPLSRLLRWYTRGEEAVETVRQIQYKSKLVYPRSQLGVSARILATDVQYARTASRPRQDLTVDAALA